MKIVFDTKMGNSLHQISLPLDNTVEKKTVWLNQEF